MCVSEAVPALTELFAHVFFSTVVLSAIQDILLQIHLRECGLL